MLQLNTDHVLYCLDVHMYEYCKQIARNTVLYTCARGFSSSSVDARRLFGGPSSSGRRLYKGPCAGDFDNSSDADLEPLDE